MCLGKIGVATRVWQDGGVPLGLVGTGSTAETGACWPAPALSRERACSCISDSPSRFSTANQRRKPSVCAPVQQRMQQ